jgi:hypothetical protein
MHQPVLLPEYNRIQMSAHSPALIRSVMCRAIMMVVASVNDMAWRRPTPFGQSIAEADQLQSEAQAHLIQMTRCVMAAADLFPHRLMGLTLWHGLRAAWMKTTARGGIERIGHLARQDHALSPQRWV